ncbi:hypothetical protein [Nocardia sp. alder85J]|uniref:hypothetical protein n=1 Tax=Nocardia sp. alder85J TaxID=2862949 RepID=UPI001CD77AF5|nr:hypothetical protein [Nocardia sp. alder85J]MCX4092900.1 hypothetical protein [Nocardia sp. alder85J]
MAERWAGLTLAGVCAVGALLAGLSSIAGATPPPGTQFDVPKLERDMEECVAYAMPPAQVLAGWVNPTTGQTLQWRCDSLRHMYVEQTNLHDPFVNVDAFVRCTDRIISCGPPHPATKPPYMALIYQYNGTSRRGYVIYHPATSDSVTIYTDPDNDWAGCANGR